MKTLLVLRHAKSSWDIPNLADHDRPLNERGKRDAPRMGRLLRELDLVPELIIASSAERAMATAELVADACGYEGECWKARAFYHAEAEDYIAHLQELSDEWQRVMIVGHNPGMEDLVETLTGEYVRMPTAALVQIELPLERWKLLSEQSTGKLINVWQPRELR